ncbi:hypothetical protein ACFQ0X_00545 [Streptomyces rectiviolaceus]|uniref:Uncharacterized protein n=1 Tax=Streptomyces rectiviolaceus TaxID=332591 RepID=A0ABP6NMB8_9ACTN
MPQSEADLLALLRELADLEWPQRYNCGEAAAFLGDLATWFGDDFAARCTAEQDSQGVSGNGGAVPADRP